MLQNEPTLAIVAVDTEENERLKFGVNYSIYSFRSLVTTQAKTAFSRIAMFHGTLEHTDILVLGSLPRVSSLILIIDSGLVQNAEPQL